MHVFSSTVTPPEGIRPSSIRSTLSSSVKAGELTNEIVKSVKSTLGFTEAAIGNVTAEAENETPPAVPSPHRPARSEDTHERAKDGQVAVPSPQRPDHREDQHEKAKDGQATATRDLGDACSLHRAACPKHRNGDALRLRTIVASQWRPIVRDHVRELRTSAFKLSQAALGRA